MESHPLAALVPIALLACNLTAQVAWRDRTAPTPPFSGGVNRQEQVYLDDVDRTVVYGGTSSGAGTASGRFFVLDRSGNDYEWTELTRNPTWPPELAGGALGYDSANHQLVLFGGKDAQNQYSSQTYVADTSGVLNDNLQWTASTQPPGGPVPRTDHAVCSDPATGAVWMYGGRDQFGNISIIELWKWNGTTMQWDFQVGSNTGNNPGRLADASMVWIPEKEQLMLFGGIDDNNMLSDEAWFWDVTTSTWTGFAPGPGQVGPSARMGAAMIHSPSDDRIYVYGGDVNNQGSVFALTDFWAWQIDASPAWVELTSLVDSLPPVAKWPVMTRDSKRNEVTAFVLPQGTSQNETWVFTPPETFIPANAPPGLSLVGSDVQGNWASKLGRRSQVFSWTSNNGGGWQRTVRYSSPQPGNLTVQSGVSGLIGPMAVANDIDLALWDRNEGEVHIAVGLGASVPTAPNGYVRYRRTNSSSQSGFLLPDLSQPGTGSGDDRFGCAIDSAGDFNDDGIEDLIVGACQNPVGFEGYAQIFSGADNSLIAHLQPPAMSNGSFGTSVAGLGDVDGDGVDDVAVGDPGNSSVHIYLGPNATPLPAITSPANSGFGQSICALDDIDGDGFGDFAVTLPVVGAVEVHSPISGPLFGLATPSTGMIDDSVANAGDVDGDGINELVVGVPEGDFVAIVKLSPSPPTQIGAFNGSTGSMFGASVAGGDTDEDGFAEIIVGAPLAETGAGAVTGQVYLCDLGSPPIAPQGFATTFGNACISTLNTFPRPTACGPFRVGMPFTAGLRDGIPNSGALFAIGLPLAQPVPLVIAGFPQFCSLATDVIVTSFLLTDPVGQAELSLPLPPNPIYIGQQLAYQWFVYDPGLALQPNPPALKFIVSDAMVLTIGG